MKLNELKIGKRYSTDIGEDLIYLGYDRGRQIFATEPAVINPEQWLVLKPREDGDYPFLHPTTPTLDYAQGWNDAMKWVKQTIERAASNN